MVEPDPGFRAQTGFHPDRRAKANQRDAPAPPEAALVGMADALDDADLETHVNGFLTALGERPEELIGKHLAEVEQPNPQHTEDLRRYVNDLKRVYGQGLLDMYRRIESHGRAICGLTDEAEITERVQEIMALVALDGADVPRILASFDEAANQLNPLTIVRLFM